MIEVYDCYIVRCLCVFDTVNSVGLPKEISLNKAERPLFGLPDKKLGKYIERAYQALALDEDRIDFVRKIAMNVSRLLKLLLGLFKTRAIRCRSTERTAIETSKRDIVLLLFILNAYIR